MGLFDSVIIEYDIPHRPRDSKGPQEDGFQSKDFQDQPWMDLFRIDKEGRLFRLLVQKDSENAFACPDDDSIKDMDIESLEWESHPFTGEAFIYTNYYDAYDEEGCTDYGGWIEYRFRFNDGVMISMELTEFDSAGG